MDETREQMIQRWLDEVSPYAEIALLAILQREGRPRTAGYLARRLRLNRWHFYGFDYVPVLWAAKKLAIKGLVREWHRSGSGGGSRRMVELVAGG